MVLLGAAVQAEPGFEEDAEVDDPEHDQEEGDGDQGELHGRLPTEAAAPAGASL
jgi:hypothetical protein